MNATLVIDRESLSALGVDIERATEDARLAAQEAAGEAMREVVMANIGEFGADRPQAWPPLSPAYAKKVRRTYATLEVTGLLRSNVKLAHLRDASIVHADDADVPYAVVHQFGGGNNIPARPYFPVTEDGEVTQFAADWALDAARQAFKEALP